VNTQERFELKEETVREQLAHLNERSRWYSTQLWQIPFAYLGISGVAIASLNEPSPATLVAGGLAAGMFGALVFWHSCLIKRSECRAIRMLQCIEAQLGLPTCQQAKHFRWDNYLMMTVTALASLFYFGLAVFAPGFMPANPSSPTTVATTAPAVQALAGAGVNWTAVGAGATCVYAVIFTYSVWVLVQQWRASAFAAVAERLQQEDVRGARRHIFSAGMRANAETLDKWTDKDKREAELVCTTYDIVGQMAKRKMIKKAMVLDEWGDSLRRAWSILGPFVKKRRLEADWPPFWDDFESLGEAAIKRFGAPEWNIPPPSTYVSESS